MSFLQSPLFWLATYVVVAAAILFAGPIFAAIARGCGLGAWFTERGFRVWVAALWPGFLVGVAAVGCIALVVFASSFSPTAASEVELDDPETENADEASSDAG
jgi:hypothetical protein